MKIHADTSTLMGWFDPADEFALSVTSWCRERRPEFYWNPLLRAELRHNLRRLSGQYAAVAWHAYHAAESSQRLKTNVHRVNDLLEWGDELSARHAPDFAAGTWDFVHVAAAKHLHAEVFITCDVAQADLARTAKLPLVRLFK